MTSPSPKEAAGDDKVDKYLGFMQESALRMQQLIRDLLNLSRSGRGEIQCRPIALDRCVDRALALFDDQICNANGIIRRDPLPKVLGDETLLVQLYQNLIGNALKFNDTKPPAIHFTAQKKNNQIILGVKDNGIGIDAMYDQQIFHPFKRLHGRHRYSGTGIGLSICKKVVTRLGGRIWVERDIEHDNDIPLNDDDGCSDSPEHGNKVSISTVKDAPPNNQSDPQQKQGQRGTWIRFTLVEAIDKAIDKMDKPPATPSPSVKERGIPSKAGTG